MFRRKGLARLLAHPFRLGVDPSVLTEVDLTATPLHCELFYHAQKRQQSIFGFQPSNREKDRDANKNFAQRLKHQQESADIGATDHEQEGL
jgi:hypothetical protein